MSRVVALLWCFQVVGCAARGIVPSMDGAHLDAAQDASVDVGMDAVPADAIDFTDLHYPTEIPDVQWGPRDATRGDIDCPRWYLVQRGDGGGLVRLRLVMCSEWSGGWTSPEAVCCRRMFLQSRIVDPPEVVDPSWPVLCVHQSDCRLGGVP